MARTDETPAAEFRGPITEMWEVYERANVNAGAGKWQREETRRAFFTGAWGVLVALIENSTDSEKAQRCFSRLIDEARLFAAMNIKPSETRR